VKDELERLTTRELGGRRNVKMSAYDSGPSVELPEPWATLKIVCHERKSFPHHSLWDKAEKKYSAGADIPVLVTRVEGDDVILASIPIALLRYLLDGHKGNP
tara:strand:- start:2871 stop:3176 length:306 start_codon:yes stop_codon:yes gene_type:complete